MGKETRLLTLAAIGLCVLAAIIVLTSKKKTETPPLATTTESMYDNTPSNPTTAPTTTDASQNTTDNNKIASAYKTLDQNGVLKEEVAPPAPATRKIVAPQATPHTNTVVPNDVASVNTAKKSEEFTEKGNTKKVAAIVKPKATVQSGYVIIGGAFSDIDNAKTELARLKKMGFGKASISKQESNGYEMINLAHFNDEASARDYVARCKKKGVSAYVKKVG